MHINFDKIVATNFKSFKDVTFDFNSFERKLVIVTAVNEDIPGDDARNGCGKTTLFDALLYAVYGDTIKPLKSEFLRNWNAADTEDVEVKLFMTVDDTKYIISRRQVGKRSSTKLSVSKFNSETDEYEDITRSSIADTQKMIERDIVHCTEEFFMMTIILTKKETYNFFNLTGPQKNAFFEELFGLQVFSNMLTKVHQETLAIVKKIAGYSTSIDTINGLISDLKKRKDSVMNDDGEIQIIKNRIAELQKELDDFDATHVIMKPAEYDSAIAECSTLKNRMVNGNNKINETENAIRAVKSELSTVHSKIASMNMNISSLEKNINAHSSLQSILCDDCLPLYNKHCNLDEYQRQIDELKIRVDEYTSKITPITEKQTTLEQNLAKYKTLLTTIQDKYTETHKVIEEYDRNSRAINEARAKIDRSLEIEEANLRNYRRHKADDFDTAIESHIEEMSKQQDMLIEYENDEVYHKALEAILDKETVRKNIANEMMKMIEQRFVTYLLGTGFNYICSFNDEFDVDFTSNNGKRMSYNNLSDGEEQRVKICISLAFRDFLQSRLNITSNLMIMDEYIDSGIDTMAVNGILEMLRYMVNSSTEAQSIFLVSHRSEILTSFTDSTVTVHKSNNESRLDII